MDYGDLYGIYEGEEHMLDHFWRLDSDYRFTGESTVCSVAEGDVSNFWEGTLSGVHGDHGSIHKGDVPDSPCLSFRPFGETDENQRASPELLYEARDPSRTRRGSVRVWRVADLPRIPIGSGHHYVLRDGRWILDGACGSNTGGHRQIFQGCYDLDKS